MVARGKPGSAKANRATWRDADGVKRQRSFAKRQEARELENEMRSRSARIQAQRAMGVYVPSDALTLATRDLMGSRLGAQPVRESTRKTYSGLIANHVDPVFDRRLVRELRKGEIQAWVTDLSSRRSRATVRQCLTIFKAALQSAVDDDRLGRNPAKGVRLPEETKGAQRRALTTDQLEALAEAIEPRYRALILTMAYAGLRPGEALALWMVTVDTMRRHLTIDLQITASNGPLRVTTPKTGHRVVPISERLAFELAEHIRLYVDHDVTNIDGVRGLIFTTPTGVAIRLGNWRRREWRHAVESIGIPDLVPYELRHSAASLMLSSNVSPHLVAEILGHDTAMTLGVYAHSSAGQLRQAMDDFERVLGGAFGGRVVAGEDAVPRIASRAGET